MMLSTRWSKYIWWLHAVRPCNIHPQYFNTSWGSDQFQKAGIYPAVPRENPATYQVASSAGGIMDWWSRLHMTAIGLQSTWVSLVFCDEFRIFSLLQTYRCSMYECHTPLNTRGSRYRTVRYVPACGSSRVHPATCRDLLATCNMDVDVLCWCRWVSSHGWLHWSPLSWHCHINQ